MFPQLSVAGVVVALDRRLPRLREGKLLKVRFMRSTWPLVHGWFGLVSRSSMSCSRQIWSKRLTRYRAVGPRRFLGSSANWMPLSVRMVCRR